MAYKMNGFGGFGNSPVKQLLPGEHKDTWVYEGEDKREKIIDLEDRIEFINEDIFNQDGKVTDTQKSTLSELKKRLSTLRGKQEPK
jgi:hypothetical protein